MYAENIIDQENHTVSKILSSKELFAIDGRQLTLRVSKVVQRHLHVLFNLIELLGDKKINDITSFRIKETFESIEQPHLLAERATTLLAAVWEDGPIPLDLDKELSVFGCWNMHRGPISKILATLTGVLRNRARRQGKKQSHEALDEEWWETDDVPVDFQ